MKIAQKRRLFISQTLLSKFDFILILIHVSCLQFSLMVLLSNILVTVQFQQILWYNSVSRVTLPNITWWKGRGHLLKITIAAWNCKKKSSLTLEPTYKNKRLWQYELQKGPKYKSDCISTKMKWNYKINLTALGNHQSTRKISIPKR